MKYKPDKQSVAAIYDNSGSRNPLIEALPGMMPISEFMERIRCSPPVPVKNELLSYTERIQKISTVSSVFVPLDYMYCVYDSLFRMMQSTYFTRTSKECVIRTNSAFAEDIAITYGNQPQSGALLGTAGIGKTSTIKRCLSMMPQVIEHEKYLGEPFFCKQVLWLFCECPSDASVKTMVFNIVHALDLAVGSNHLDYLYRMRSTAASAMATYIKVLCMTYHVGVIVVDEIQNLVNHAKRTNQVKPLIRFLTELTNESATAIYMSGTTLAETVFTAEEHLRRRTRGPRLLPFKPDGVYRNFLQSLWAYQYTAKQVPLTDKLANQIYDYSGGIPAYITKIFVEAQVRAIMDGAEAIEGKYIKAAVDYLAITPPEDYGPGKHLSELTVGMSEMDDIKNDFSMKRPYANQRGRRAMERDALDLVQGFLAGNLQSFLMDNGLTEDIVLC